MITHIVAKTLVFNSEGKLLLLKRSASDAHRPGGPDLPGGQVDEGEDIVEGAAREVLEEAGLRLDPKEMQLVFGRTSAGHNTSAGQDTNLVHLTFAAKASEPTVTLSGEHDDFDWYSLDEAAKLMEGLHYKDMLVHIMSNKVASELWDV